MRIIKFSRHNMRQLEDGLDRIGLKHGIEPRIVGMVITELDNIMFNYGEDDDFDFDEEDY